MSSASVYTLSPDCDHEPIGRIVSVTGSKAVVLLDHCKYRDPHYLNHRPEMGTLIAIESETTISLGIVSALSVPMPGQTDGDPEVWIAELGLVGELHKHDDQTVGTFNRGISNYPALGDPVRVASHDELKSAFNDPTKSAVVVGTLRQDASIPAMVKTDDLLGKHFAILGTTGTGKSCTTALILRAIIEKNPSGHIVLLDPHNEYSTAFKEWGEVITPHNMQLPYWLLTFDEIVEVLIGDIKNYKAEVEILQELIPMAKRRYGANRGASIASLKKSSAESGKYTVDTPVPYLISEVIAILDERMGLLENKKDLAPYRQLRTKIETVIYDARYAFMFGNLTVNDNMVDVLSRLFRVPVNDKPITIIELTGLPTDVVAVVVSVICRMTFDFALWSQGKIPVTLVCEEAHRYVPKNSSDAFVPARRAIARIAKEGRKYGASLCIVTQRPAEIDPTILSQCNTVFALRMANDRDQEIVQSAIADTGSGLLEFLPALGAREAIAFGDGVTLPARIKFNKLDPSCLPRSSTAEFSAKWQSPAGDREFLADLVERWRSSGAAVVRPERMSQASNPNEPGSGRPGGLEERRSVRRRPIDQSQVNPAPVSSAPVSSAPVSPAPVSPAPVNPAPVNPAPVNPAIADDDSLLTPSSRRIQLEQALAKQTDTTGGQPPRPSIRRHPAETPVGDGETRATLRRKPVSEVQEQREATLRERAIDYATKPEKPVFK